ncbi:TonB-dependent receptor plug domain-containing protein [Porticoccus sp. GXU_MW_L64]
MTNRSRGSFTFKHLALPGAIAIALAATSGSALAEHHQPINFDIAPQSLGSALTEFGIQSGKEVYFVEADIANKSTKGLTGSYKPEDAIKMILEQSGIRFTTDSNGTILVGSEYAQQSDESNSGSAAQPTTEEAGDDTNLDVDEEVVITGSRIAKSPSQVAANVEIFSQEDLRATGATTLERALARLPQNIGGVNNELAALGGFNSGLNISGASSVNLRGLGDDATLILVDGRRIGNAGVFGGVSDISTIPLASIERIEVLLDGASAIYGSDAVGGVINVITKKDYQGIETHYSYGTPETGGYEEHILSLNGGFSWETGRLLASFEQRSTSNLDAAERAGSFQFILPSNPSPLPQITSPSSINNGVLFFRVGDTNFDSVADLEAAGFSLDTPGLIAAQTRGSLGGNAVGLPADSDGSGDLSLADFTTADPTLVPTSFEGTSLVSAENRSTIDLRLTQELSFLGDDTQFSADLYYSNREITPGAETQVFNIDVPADAPGNGLGRRIGVFFTSPFLPPEQFESDEDTFRANFGLNGTFANNWRWNIGAGRNKTDLRSIFTNQPLPQFARDEDFNFINPFLPLFEDGLNLLTGDIAAANPQDLLLRTLLGPEFVTSINTEDRFDINASGSLFSLPGGDVQVSVGADWQKTKLFINSERNISDRGDSGFEVGAFAPLGALDNVDQTEISSGVFLELLVPIVGADNSLPGIEQLDITGAVRHDNYNGTPFSATTESFGLIWSPESQFRVRANYSTSFKAPLLRDSIQAPNVQFDLSFFPGGGFSIPIVDENGLRTGDQTEAPNLLLGVINGGNPDLQPETAESFSVTLEYSPDFIPGLTLSVTERKTDNDNRIDATALSIFGLEFEPSFNTILPRELRRDSIPAIPGTDFDGLDNPDGNLILDRRAINLSAINTAGRDYSLVYNTDTDVGQFIIRANVSYTGKQEVIVTDGFAPINLVGTAIDTNRSSIPRYGYRANLGWYNRGVSINLDAASSSTTREVTNNITGSGLTQTQIFEPSTDINLVLGYNTANGDLFSVPQWLENTSITLTVDNLLDDSSERTVLVDGEPTGDELNQLQPGFTTVRGRMFFVNISKSF